VGHDDQGKVPGLDPALAKLSRHIPSRLDPRSGEPGPQPPHVLVRLRSHRWVEARVHEHWPGIGVPDQESGAGDGPPPGPRDAQHLEHLQATAGPLEGGGREVQLSAEQRLHGDRSSLSAAGEGARQSLRLGVDLHGRVSVAVQTRLTAGRVGSRVRACR